MKKRVFSTLLAAIMLLSITACSGDTGENSGNLSDDTTAPVVEALPAGIEAQNYEGTVNILMPNWGLYKNYFDPGDDLTDIMNKALAERENKIEEYLGVDITYQYADGTVLDLITQVSAAASTNDDLYQILLSHCIYPNADLIMGGYLADMNEMNIEFDADWFNVKTNEALSTQGMQFFSYPTGTFQTPI